MIAGIRGVLRQKGANRLLIETASGVTYEVFSPLTVIEQLPDAGEEVSLLTEFVVREASHSLYGFLREGERRLFLQLMKTSGVGAKTALAMQSAMTTDELIEALSAEDIARLSLTPGIGKKTAERLVVDFRGSDMMIESAAVAHDINTEVEQALVALGYKKAEIKKALGRLDGDPTQDTATRVRIALRVLSGR